MAWLPRALRDGRLMLAGDRSSSVHIFRPMARQCTAAEQFWTHILSR